jgi:hypothetical protein
MLHKTTLDRFRGGKPLYPHLLGKFFFTTEVLQLARKLDATWLIDLIALQQRSPQIQIARKLAANQFWKLTFKPNNSAILTCSCHGQIILTRRLNQTNFPQDDIELYLINLILMLADQYEEVA